ncbi:MAG: PEP-CTERM sorting domain-containing protein [Candidatus Omnitrophota bacterium]|nr:PEP-CTERM sorting domain-containing protein [Candidatus Omnitrophota bacterium]
MKKLMKKLLLLVATLLLVLGLSNAYAIPVTLDVDKLYDWGRLYSYSAGVYTPTNVNPAPFGTNPAGGYTIPENTFGNVDGAEDTWGIGTVSRIEEILTGNPIFQRSGTQELTFMFYGFDDDALSSPDFVGDTTILSKLGHISAYLDVTPDFNGTLGTGGRTGVSAYSGVTDGLLVLDLAPVDLSGSGHTLTSGFDFLTSSGNGAMYLATTGLGAWDSVYDTNTQLYGSDLSFTFTVRDNSNTPVGNWVVRGDAGGEANVIPEPTSMLLFGIGMAGLAVTKKRKKIA